MKSTNRLAATDSVPEHVQCLNAFKSNIKALHPARMQIGSFSQLQAGLIMLRIFVILGLMSVVYPVFGRAGFDELERSVPGGESVQVVFRNGTNAAVDALWVDFEGQEKGYFSLEPGQTHDQNTGVGQLWRFRQSGRLVGQYRANNKPKQRHEIAALKLDSGPTPGRPQPNGNQQGGERPGSGELERSVPGDESVQVVFRNGTNAAVDALWVDFEGKETGYYSLEPGQTQEQQTGVNHLWRFRQSGRLVGQYRATNKPNQRHEIAALKLDSGPTPGRPQPNGNQPGGERPGSGELERSVPGDESVQVVFRNGTNAAVDALWVDFEGKEIGYYSLEPGQTQDQQTGSGHLWRFRQSGRLVGQYRATNKPNQRHEIAALGGDPGLVRQDNRAEEERMIREALFKADADYRKKLDEIRREEQRLRALEADEKAVIAAWNSTLKRLDEKYRPLELQKSQLDARKLELQRAPPAQDEAAPQEALRKIENYLSYAIEQRRRELLEQFAGNGVLGNGNDAPKPSPNVELSAIPGRYSWQQPQNRYHSGEITVAEPGADGKTVLKWTNTAGRSWLLYPDLENGVLQTGKDNPFYNRNPESGRTFRLVVGTDGSVTGFRFQDGHFLRQP